MRFIRSLSLFIAATLVFSLLSHAQEMGKPLPVRVRAVFHDPAHPVASLFYPDKTGAIVPLNFRPQDLTKTLMMMPVNGSLVLYDKLAIDPLNPLESMAANVRLSPGIQQAMVVVLRSPPGDKRAYVMRVIDDSEKAFPYGESLALSLVGAEIAIQAGEHKVTVHPGKITRVPWVRKVNEYNMGQTNFYYKQGGSWVIFAERQLQYLEVSRRLFILHVTPGALQPTVTTIVDTRLGENR